MRAAVIAGVLAASTACGGTSRYNATQAAAAVSIAAAAAIPVAIAVNAAQAQAAKAANERPTPENLKETLGLVSLTLCERNTNYALYCSRDREHCVYRTKFGREYTCAEPDCKSGPPIELVRWCNPEGL